MRRHGLGPPPGIGRHVADLATPRGRWHAAAGPAGKKCVALVRVEVGHHAQQHALAGARMTHDRHAFARRQRQIHRADVQALEAAQRQQGRGVVGGRHPRFDKKKATSA
jgi:hypothetical protein